MLLLPCYSLETTPPSRDAFPGEIVACGGDDCKQAGPIR
jgi:hypothetical protein